MKKKSSGLLMYHLVGDDLEVFLVHPGGPYFAKKDEGAWSIPKGEIEEGEDLLECAIREFHEEIGFLPKGEFIPLDWVKQKGGKVVHAWAFAGEWDNKMRLKSNLFEIEWPPRSGKIQKFPEIDKAEFFSLSVAVEKINPAQVEFLARLQTHLLNK